MTDTNLNTGSGPIQARTVERATNVKTQAVVLDIGGINGPEQLLGTDAPMPTSDIATQAAIAVVQALLMDVATDAGLTSIATVLGTPLQEGGTVVANVASRSSSVTVQLAVTASSAYAAGNVVGGVITFSGVFDTALSGVLESIVVKCESAQTTGYKLYLLDAYPNYPIPPTSILTNKQAPVISLGDTDKVLGFWVLNASDSGLGSQLTINQLDGIGAAIKGASSSLYGVLVCTGTPTFSSATNVSVTIRILKD